MVSIITRMPCGYPGLISRADALTIETGIIDSAAPPTSFGSFVKVVAGKIQPVAPGDAAWVVHAVLIQPYPISASTVVAPLAGTVAPPTSGVCSLMRRGYAAVSLASGYAAKKGQVYVVTTAGGTSLVGNIVTSSSPASGGAAVAVTGAFFTGPADASGATEIEFNI